jgi:transcriptional regulator with XRE-family HTH domain
MSKNLTKTVARAIEKAPCSLRALAREAGVAPSTLTRIRTGELEPTVELADRIARALDSLARQAREQSGRCARLARTIRQARKKHRKRGRPR